ncbi:MAG: glycosyltransferase [Candidatus Nanohalobium sp.]
MLQNGNSSYRMKKASLICTVYNEGDSMEELLDSIVEQTVTPAEAVFVDGGSTDGTQGVIRKYAEEHDWIHLIVEEGCNIAEGRNIAVENAENDYIVSTDGGCVLDEKWYEEMCKAFEESEYVIGMFRYRADNLFEKVQGEIICSAHTVEELRKGNRGPSSRSVGFSRQAWKDAGGYPEDLYTGEDSKFNAKILSESYEPAIAENAMVYWKMRPTWKALWNQFKTYGEGDAKGGNLFTHPSQKLGVSKNLWLFTTATLTLFSGATTIASAVFKPELTVYNAVILLGLLTIPKLYYLDTLKKLLKEEGVKALLIGFEIAQLKYWAWYAGFTLTLLKKPSLIPYQFREAVRLG